MNPCDNEPDSDIFITTYGLPAILKRNSLRAWCGYVGVERSHPWFGKAYGALVDLNFAYRMIEPLSNTFSALNQNSQWPHSIDGVIDVHGGLTFSGKILRNLAKLTNEQKTLWWFGFDASHSMDLPPGIPPEKWQRFNEAAYRDFNYMKHQCEILASQLVCVE